jgi:hypothetical protein
MIFLIEYDRNKGRLITLKTFEDTEKRTAENTRLEMELRLRQSGIEREVVLMQAANEKALRRTHRRYFENLGELAKAP